MGNAERGPATCGNTVPRRRPLDGLVDPAAVSRVAGYGPSVDFPRGQRKHLVAVALKLVVDLSDFGRYAQVCKLVA